MVITKRFFPLRRSRLSRSVPIESPYAILCRTVSELLQLIVQILDSLQFYTENIHFAFLSHFGGLEATQDDHLRLIGKPVVDFLLVLIELFSLGVTAEVLRVNVSSKSSISLQWGPVDPKFQVEFHQPFFFSEN